MKNVGEKKPEQNFVRNEKADFIGRQVSKRRNELDWTQIIWPTIQDAGGLTLRVARFQN